MSKKVKLIGTTNRIHGYISPTQSDFKCGYFGERFIEWGNSRERRAICEKKDAGVLCGYEHITDDGTRLCLRYEHQRSFEVLPKRPAVKQKKDGAGVPLFWDITVQPHAQTTTDTGMPVWVPVYDDLIPFLEANKDPAQETDSAGNLLYWDYSVFPVVKTTTVTPYPITDQYRYRQWFSDEYVDTHEKIFTIKDGVLGWHHDV